MNFDDNDYFHNLFNFCNTHINKIKLLFFTFIFYYDPYLNFCLFLTLLSFKIYKQTNIDYEIKIFFKNNPFDDDVEEDDDSLVDKLSEQTVEIDTNFDNNKLLSSQIIKKCTS